MNAKQQAIKAAWGESAYNEIHKALSNCHSAPWALKEFTEKGRVVGNLIRDPDVTIHIYGRSDVINRNGHYWPKSITNISTNNGWTRIDGPDDLPKEDCKCLFNGHGGFRMKIYYNSNSNNKQWYVDRFTHWRPVEEVPEPVY